MKILKRSIIVAAGLLVAATTPVQGETSKKIAAPLSPTDAPPNQEVVGTSRSVDYHTAYQQGTHEAEEHIATGTPSIYTVGLWRPSPDRAAVDQQTGLPLVGIAGCLVDDSIMGRMNGYNDRIRQWITEQAAVTQKESRTQVQLQQRH